MSAHATCEDCGRTMDKGVGCSLSHVLKSEGGEQVARIRCGQSGDWAAPSCHDCNAPEGALHHPGCDTERCPECGNQMLGCWGPPDAEFGGCGWLYLSGPVELTAP